MSKEVKQKEEKRFETVYFWCEAYNTNNNKTFARYIKVMVDMNSEYDTKISYRIYGHKIIENKGLPLIQVGYAIIEEPLDGTIEQLATAALKINIINIHKIEIFEEPIFNFMIEQQ